MIIGFQYNPQILESTGIKKGVTVLVPKGTKVVSTHPSKGTYFTKRDLKVKVYTIGSGQNVPVYERDYQQQINEYSKQEGAHCILAFSKDGSIIPRGLSASVPLHNPEVIWHGTGGYWCHVDINKVTLIKE